MSEPRSARLIPEDQRSHINRINDWVGSDSYVEGARRDQEDTPMPEGQKFPYILLSKAWWDGAMRRAGDVVHVHPSQVGPHHGEIEGIDYPADAPEAPGWGHSPPAFGSAAVAVADADAVTAMAAAIAARDARIAELEAENAALKPPVVEPMADKDMRNAALVAAATRHFGGPADDSPDDPDARNAALMRAASARPE